MKKLFLFTLTLLTSFNAFGAQAAEQTFNEQEIKALEINFKQHTERFLNGMALSPDGTILSLVGDDGVDVLINTATGEKIWNSTAFMVETCYGKSPLRQTATAFSPNGKLFVRCGEQGSFSIINTETKEIVCFKGCDNGRHISIDTCTFSDDSQQLITGSNSGEVIIWDITEFTAKQKLHISMPRMNHAWGNNPVHKVIVDSKNKRLATCCEGYPRIWSSQTGEELFGIFDRDIQATKCALSPDGCYLAVATNIKEHPVRIWKIQADGSGKEIEDINFCGSQKKLKSDFSIEKGFYVQKNKVTPFVKKDPKNKAYYFATNGHTDKVNDVVFSPDGSKLITASEDGTVRVWDFKTGEFIAACTAPSDTILTHVTVSQDGRFIAARSWYSIFVWKMPPEMLKVTTLSEKLLSSASSFFDSRPQTTLEHSAAHTAPYSEVLPEQHLDELQLERDEDETNLRSTEEDFNGEEETLQPHSRFFQVPSARKIVLFLTVAGFVYRFSPNHYKTWVRERLRGLFQKLFRTGQRSLER